MTSADMFEVAIVVTTVVILVTILIVLILRRSKAQRRSVLICGLSDAGKTLLTSQLSVEKYVATQSSMKENCFDYQVPNSNKMLKLVDIPGHERLRLKYLDDFKSSARAIIYVIDSSSFMSQLRDVAEYLYIILSDRSLTKLSLPVLIACNKQDELMKKSQKVIKSSLEKEFNSLRVTKSAALDSISGSNADHDVMIGKKGVAFEFNHLKSFNIQFAECSAKESDVKAVRQWISSKVA